MGSSLVKAFHSARRLSEGCSWASRSERGIVILLGLKWYEVRSRESSFGKLVTRVEWCKGS